MKSFSCCIFEENSSFIHIKYIFWLIAFTKFWQFFFPVFNNVFIYITPFTRHGTEYNVIPFNECFKPTILCYEFCLFKSFANFSTFSFNKGPETLIFHPIQSLNHYRQRSFISSFLVIILWRFLSPSRLCSKSIISSILRFRMLWIWVFPTPSSSASLRALFVLHSSITFIRSSKVRSHVLKLSFNYKTTKKLVKLISIHL